MSTAPFLAPPRCIEGEILENRQITPVTFVMKIHAPEITPTIRPGQFVNLETSKDLVPLLRRPMSVHRVVGSAGQATGFCVLYDVVGPGTRNLSEMKPREKISFVGPLGNTLSVPEGAKRAVLVAGGIGVGPIRFVAESLQNIGVREITVCYGARDADHSVPVEDVAPNGCRMLICTDDGSVGRKGFATQFIDDLNAKNRLAPGDYVFTCGPHAMFKTLRDLLRPHGIAAEAATEEFMGCGFGVCFGCPLHQRQEDGSVELKLCCVDGCLFPLDSLVFEGDPELAAS